MDDKDEEPKLSESEALLMEFMDEELPPQRMAEVNNRLMRDAVLRAEYESLRQACGRLERVGMDSPNDEALKSLWRSPFSVGASRIALWMIGLGLATLLGLALYALASSGIRLTAGGLAFGAIVVGIVILLIVKIRERVKSLPADPYKDIEK